MRKYAGIACLLLLLPSTAIASNDCIGPVTGRISDSNFRFTYESWWMHDTSNRSRPFYRFVRCLYNEDARPLWFDWKKTGLESRIVEGDQSALIFFDESRDDKLETDKELWYGPGPVKIDVLTVLRPKEATLPQPKERLINDFGFAEMAA